MIDLIPAPYRLMAAGIAIVLAALLGVAGGAWMAVQHFEPQLATANEKIGELENSNASLSAGITHQNIAIETEHNAGEQRREKANAAAKQAHSEAQTYYGNAQAILGLRPPPGADPCRAARDAFDEELRAERGK